MAIYDDVISLGRTYMGPGAEKFVSRQISTHLKVSGADLRSQDLEELAKWCFISGKLVMDEAKAQEFSQKIKALR